MIVVVALIFYHCDPPTRRDYYDLGVMMHYFVVAVVVSDVALYLDAVTTPLVE